MSKNEITNTLLTNYVDTDQEKKKFLKPLRVNKEAGKTLEDFYTEAQAHRRAHGIENVYYSKTADEIEVIMMTNRKRIEANYTKR